MTWEGAAEWDAPGWEGLWLRFPQSPSWLLPLFPRGCCVSVHSHSLPTGYQDLSWLKCGIFIFYLKVLLFSWCFFLFVWVFFFPFSSFASSLLSSIKNTDTYTADLTTLLLFVRGTYCQKLGSFIAQLALCRCGVFSHVYISK